jgi:regulator of replication initiation timing
MKDKDVDILDELRFHNCLPLSMREIENGIAHLWQSVPRAADEIERLREENRELRKECKRLRKGLTS